MNLLFVNSHHLITLKFMTVLSWSTYLQKTLNNLIHLRKVLPTMGNSQIQIHSQKLGKPSKRLQNQIKVRSLLEFLQEDLKMEIKIFLNFSSNSSSNPTKGQINTQLPIRDILQPLGDKYMQKILKLTIGKILSKLLVQMGSQPTNLLRTIGKCFLQYSLTKIRSAEKS